MKKLLPLLLIIGLFTPISAARAHPADVYAHTLKVTLAASGMKIRWELKPGPMLVSFLWYEADANQDGALSAEEKLDWGKPRAALFSATLNGQGLPLTLDSLDFPSDLQAFQAGAEFITLNLSAHWEAGAHQLVLKNNMETKKSINFFELTAADPAAFLFPAQHNHTLNIALVTDRSLLADQTGLLTQWDSGAPSLPAGQQKDLVTQTAEQVVPELSQRSPQEILLDLVRAENFSLPFYLLALSVALALGALHALTPGHGKTIVAAYLVGSRGNAWHAIALGSIVTVTHTGSVFALGLITLTASRYFFTADFIPMLELLSGALIVLLGMGLLLPRLRGWLEFRRRETLPAQRVRMAGGGTRLILNAAITEDAPAHKHDGAIPRMPQAELNWRSLITLGISGGLVPCPDAIAILLVAVAINRIALGLALILSFSVGLAVVLIVIGMLMVGGGNLFARMNFLSRVAPLMPVLSAAVVIVLGFALTYGAAQKMRDRESAARLFPMMRVEEARVLYLFEDEENHRQLYWTEAGSPNPVQLTQSPRGVTDFSLSLDQTRVAYIEQTEDLQSNLRLLALEGGEDKLLAACGDGVCAQPVWSPDGKRLIYEYMPMEEEGYGASSLWWLDVSAPQPQPVFQESRLPGANPRWSPDGDWLSYSSPDGIRLTHFPSGESRLLKNALGAAAAWSPDGASILLRDVALGDGRFLTRLFVYGIESQKMAQVGGEEGVEYSLAAWSPDGRQIAVVRRDVSIPRGDQIWVMRPDGRNARALTSAPAVLHGSLSWSPDGRYLLYDVYLLASVPLQARLERVDLQSGEVTPLGVSGYSPLWALPSP